MFFFYKTYFVLFCFFLKAIKPNFNCNLIYYYYFVPLLTYHLMRFLPLSSKLSLRRSLKKNSLCAFLLKLSLRLPLETLFLQIAWIFLFLYKPSHDRPIPLQIQFARYFFFFFFLLTMYFNVTSLSCFMLKISPLFGFSYVVLHLYCHIFQILILNPTLLKLRFLQIAWIFLFLYKPSHDRPIPLQKYTASRSVLLALVYKLIYKYDLFYAER